jgi:hypothetical protein
LRQNLSFWQKSAHANATQAKSALKRLSAEDSALDLKVAAD